MARLLIVEDDPDQLELRRLILEYAGHRVRTAADPRAALEAFVEFAPALVVMDLRLPRTEDGLSLIEALRQRFPEVRIVVLSGAEDNFENSAVRALVNEYVRKPVPSRELVRLVSKLVCDSIGA